MTELLLVGQFAHNRRSKHVFTVLRARGRT